MALRGNIRPAASISGGIKKASSGGAASFEVDETLSLLNGVLSVNTTDQVEEGNKLPVTSGGVYAAVGKTVDRALEQAKENGDFDGDPGKSAYEYALDGGYTGSEEAFAEKLAKEYPTKISELENDSKFITASGAPVQSVNGKSGAVTLSANDVGALPNTYTPPNQTAEQVGADPSGTAAGKVAAHNTNTGAHSDIRLLISTLATRLYALANSDDTTLDQMAEVVAYIKDNRELIEQITTGKVSVADIINNLSTNVANKPLSAAQGVALKALIDGLSSGKLDASKLTEAVNTALAQAKASGEFDGEPGTSVAVKSVSESTADGGSNVVTFSDGKTLTVKNGKQGSPGYTPQKHTDYWTTADQESIVQDVLAALGTPIFGRVDADKNIITTGDLADGTYTYWYEGKDGKLVKVGTVEIGGATYTNQIPLSVDTDGSIYNGAGYKTYSRLNSSGAPVDNAGGIEPTFVTGFIPVKNGDVIRLKNCYIDTTNSKGQDYYGTGATAGSMRIGYFNKETFASAAIAPWTGLSALGSTISYTVDADGHVTQFTVNGGDVYLRLTLAGDPETAILTINQEIPN